MFGSMFMHILCDTFKCSILFLLSAFEYCMGMLNVAACVTQNTIFIITSKNLEIKTMFLLLVFISIWVILNFMFEKHINLSPDNDQCANHIQSHIPISFVCHFCAYQSFLSQKNFLVFRPRVKIIYKININIYIKRDEPTAYYTIL